MWPPDFANRLSLIKCLYSSEKTPPPQKKPLVFRTMTFQKVSPSVGFSPIEFPSSRVYGRSLHRYSPVCVDLWAGSLPGWQSTVKLLSWLLCFSSAPSTFLSLVDLDLKVGMEPLTFLCLQYWEGLYQLCWSWR